MAFGLETIVRRLEWLEKQVLRLARAIEALKDAAAADRLATGEARRRAEENRLVILRPDGALAAATFHAAVPYSAGPPEVDYVPPRIVPTTGTGRVWQTFSETTGELRAGEFVRRYVPASDPPEYSDEDAEVEYDNINSREGIPATARYVICMRQGGRLIAVSWDCGETT